MSDITINEEEVFPTVAEKRVRRIVCVSIIKDTFFEAEVQRFEAGSFTNVWEFCKSLFWPHDKLSAGAYNKCCRGGAIDLPVELPYPSFLKDLLCNTDLPHHTHFINNLHRYNAVFRVASVSDKVDESVSKGKSWFYRVSGQIHHIMRPVRDNKEVPNLGQLFLVSPETSTEIRYSAKNRGVWLKKDILEPLDLFLRDNNPYAQLYKSMGDLEAEVTETGGSIENYALKFHERRGRDAGRYNAPRVEEVAVIFDLRDGALPPKQTLVVHHRLQGENQSIFMPIVSQHHDPCCYPLLFPYGNMGWYEGLPLARSRGGVSCVSLREYKRFYFHEREDIFNPILFAPNLMQQLAVDAFVQIEARSISFMTGARSQYANSKDF